MYTVFVIELHSRRVQIVGSTPHPDEAFMLQVIRELPAPHGMLGGKRPFLCDRDRKWSLAVRQLLERSRNLLKNARSTSIGARSVAGRAMVDETIDVSQRGTESRTPRKRH